MDRLREFRPHNLFHRRKNSENGRAWKIQIVNQADSTTNIVLPSSPRQSAIQCAQPTHPTLDLWKTAYDQLDDAQRKTLLTIQLPTSANDKESHSQTKALLDEVIHITKEQYEQYQQKADGKHRLTSRKIINATLSFKDMITAVAAFDPTQHAASAWTIVLLGLTMTKNYNDLRDALFESSEYLADVLAQCAFIEKDFYHDSSSSIKEDVGNALVRLYGAILRYTAQIRDAQHPRMGRKVLDCITAITEHPLTTLQALVDKERDNIFRWIGLVKHLHREKEAENTLRQIDILAESMKHLIEQFDLVNLRVAEGAFYDSYINEHEDFCLPDTRSELRSQISEWVESTEGKCIFWLNGMAGTGKSTIARTVAQLFKDKRQLGATFFFKRGEADRGSAKYLISTITRQLVTRHRRLVPDVLSAIENDPNISSKFLGEQFDKLLLRPLHNLRLDQPTTTVVVIDALDECDQDDIRVILRLLFSLQDFQSIRLRIFLTSRPELPINLGFKQNDNHQDVFLHELPSPVIERDIRLFLEDKLFKIRDERSLSLEWPGNENIEKLVKMAVPLFIFAATICRFIGDRRWRPEKRLEVFLQDQVTLSGSRMDRTYLPILNQLLSGANDQEIQQLRQEFQDIIGIIILLATPLSVNALAQLIQLPRIDISNRLDGFHSVLNVPENVNSPIRILHLSFRDYLLTTDSPFYIDETDTHRKITLHCLRVMNTSLKHNICGLPSYGTLRDDIDNQTVNRHLSADLQYACQHWVYHLLHSEGRIEESQVFAFLKTHFLHWLEALSLIGVISEAVTMIDSLPSGDRKDTDAGISDFLHDAKRFILKNISIADTAPLQLYYSGLVFLPMQSVIRKMFSDSRPKQITILPQVEDYWSPELQTIEGHSGQVWSVVFSSDGQMVASGFSDDTIKLWDAKTGFKLQTLKGHLDWVYSVAFSSNGQMVASGSGDNTIKLWDTKTGSELRTLKGHFSWVQSVAFSSDGQLVASGSSDETIKLWDVKTGCELHTLKGHLSWVRSVAFSSDGQMVASGSGDHTVKLWDAKTGSELKTLKGHLNSVQTVAFSSDDQLVASGSSDNTIKLWDAKTGSELKTLKGHLDSVQTVAFSSNGQLVASGSSDNTVKLWDAKTGSELQTLKGHLDSVQAVAFSSDSQLVASGSHDDTIKLWDAKIDSKQQTLKGHSSWVYSVAFSSDGQTVVSGSGDHTVKLWDTKTGSELKTLKGHLNSVQTVAFSSDDQIVASGSSDNTIKLWDTKTGSELQTLKGHLGSIYSVAFSSNGQMVASGSGDHTVKLWDSKIGSELKTLKGHLNGLWSVAFSSDGLMVASGSSDHTIKLWDVKTGCELHTLKGHLSWVRSVAFSSDDQMVASGSGDNTIKLWDTKTGSELRTLKGHLSWVRSVAFSSDGQLVASGSHDETIKLWDAKTGSQLQTLKGHLGSAQSMVNPVALSSSMPSTVLEEEQTVTKPNTILQPCDKCDPTWHNFNIKTFISDNWVSLMGENILWLPPEHRRFTSSIVKEASLALGYSDGRVSIIGFHT